MNKKQYYIYLMMNYANTVIYIGVTNNLQKRIYEHKNKIIKGFTSKYKVNKLVYFEIFDDVKTAIEREKQLKAGSRARKIAIIVRNNPNFRDLYPNII